MPHRFSPVGWVNEQGRVPVDFGTIIKRMNGEKPEIADRRTKLLAEIKRGLRRPLEQQQPVQ